MSINNFWLYLIAEANRLNHLVVPAIVAARAEFEMPIDQETYSEAIGRSVKGQEARVEAYIESIRSLSTGHQGGQQNAPKA